MATTDDTIDQWRVASNKTIRLKDFDPGWAGDPDLPKAERKQFAENVLSQDVSKLAEAQDQLYAANRWSILIILQAMDAAGKDGAIKHVMSGINPQGCQVYSFKQPSALELAHDFLWRTTVDLPERGRIGIFNRSNYEEVLRVRVHPELWVAEKLPEQSDSKQHLWHERYRSINAREHHLRDN